MIFYGRLPEAKAAARLPSLGIGGEAMMRRRRATIEALVIDAYRQSRGAGLDEWTACEAALAEFRMRHPEVSIEYANIVISQALAKLGAPTPELPALRHPAVSAVQADTIV